MALQDCKFGAEGAPHDAYAYELMGQICKGARMPPCLLCAVGVLWTRAHLSATPVFIVALCAVLCDRAGNRNAQALENFSKALKLKPTLWVCWENM